MALHFHGFDRAIRAVPDNLRGAPARSARFAKCSGISGGRFAAPPTAVRPWS